MKLLQCALYIATIGILSNPVAALLPREWFQGNAFPYAPREWE